MEIKTETVMLDKARRVAQIKTVGHVYLPAELIDKKIVGVIVKK